MKKEKNENIAMQLSDIENLSTHSVKMNDTIAAQLKSKDILECKIEDISKHFQSPTLFDKYNKAINDLIEKCIPDGIEDKCKFCKEESKEDSDRLCNKYRYQMSSTFFFAAKSFDVILEANKKIIKDKDFINRLAIEFFNCFYGVKTTGTLYFNSKELSKMVLKAGFLSIAIEIEKNENLKSLELINESIDKIETFELTKGFTDKPQPLYPKKQKKFLKQKQEYLKNKVDLEKIQPKVTSFERPNRTDIAFFLYYTSNSKESKLVNKVPTEKSFKEAGELFNKTWKNVQTVYNKIQYPINRIKHKNKEIIKYVINDMLMDYPKAKSLAEDDLKEISVNP